MQPRPRSRRLPSTCDGQPRGTRQICRQCPPASPPHTLSRPPSDPSGARSHRHTKTRANPRPRASPHRAIVLAASCGAWSMHMQPLALPAAAPADRHACAHAMQHASEVPIWHPGEVTSRSSRRPPAASARRSKATASTLGMKTSAPMCSDMVSSKTRFCIDLHTCSVSGVL